MNSNPFIVKLIGYTDDPLTIVMKKYETDLFKYAMDSSHTIVLTDEQKLGLILDIARGIKGIHDLNVAHLDLKSRKFIIIFLSFS